MKNRTYRYFKGTTLYPFGYGLSYTTFKAESDAKATGFVPEAEADYFDLQKTAIEVSVEVTNTGDLDGDEVVLAYVDKKPSEKVENGKNAAYKDALDPSNQPIKSLCGFKRVSLKKGETKKVSLPISAYSLTTVLEDGRIVFLNGEYTIKVYDKDITVTL